MTIKDDKRRITPWFSYETIGTVRREEQRAQNDA